ncbi:unnamed protein product, partial [Ixodes hexagonus]
SELRSCCRRTRIRKRSQLRPRIPRYRLRSWSRLQPRWLQLRSRRSRLRCLQEEVNGRKDYIRRPPPTEGRSRNRLVTASFGSIYDGPSSFNKTRLSFGIQNLLYRLSYS